MGNKVTMVYYVQHVSTNESSTVPIVFVGTAEYAWSEAGFTYPTKPDAELGLWQHGEVKPLGTGLDVERLLFTPQRTKQPPWPAG